MLNFNANDVQNFLGCDLFSSKKRKKEHNVESHNST